MGRRLNKTDRVKNEKRDAMWEAVRKFNTMVPTLNSFARSLTGNSKIRVKAGKQTQTDGRLVEIRPPVSLATKLDHERDLCERRDSDKQLMCMACDQNENIWRKLHHELAHIVSNSMELPGGAGLSEMLALVDEYHPVGTCDHGFELKQRMLGAKSYIEVAATFSGYLQHLTLTLEDARIDSRMIQVKPGLRGQFYAGTWSTFTYGVETDEGDNFFWRDAPVNAQAVIGLLLIGSGYQVEPGWLRDEVRAMLHDAELRNIVQGAGNWSSVGVTATKAVAAFRRLREIGLFDDVVQCSKKDQEDPPSLRNPGDEGEQSDEQDDTQSDEKSDDDAASNTGDDAEASDGGDGSREDASDPTGDGSAGDTASDGAFGNDFENPDDRADGDDQQGGDSDGQSEDAPVPDGDGDGRKGDDPEPAGAEDGTQGEDDSDAPDAGGDDSTDADGSTDGDESPEAGEAEGEASGDADQRQRDSSPSTAGVDGDDDAPEPDGDDSGEPVTQGEGDIGSDAGGSGDDNHTEMEPGQESDDDAASVDGGTEEDGEDEGGSSDDAYGDELNDMLRELDEDDRDEPMGESVWDEANDPLTGVRTISPEEFGSEDEVIKKLEAGNPHEHVEEGEHVEGDGGPYEEELLAIVNAALDEAISQSAYFDKSSTGVGGVVEYEFPTRVFRWEKNWMVRPDQFTPSESVIGKALMKARAVFADNQLSKRNRNLREGKINTRVLGRRAAVGDDRLFQKRQLPGKKEYIVGITLDCSGSTESFNRMERIKRAAFAKAEILSRLGIKFYITAHTGGKETFWTKDYYTAMGEPGLEDLMILWIKRPDEPWNDSTRERLAALMPLANNFDGHTLEFHRKLLQGRRETDKILIYYTDGDMPAANYDEELAILTSEIATCKKAGITLAAVGINTDSPTRYGFDTVRVESDEDVMKVVQHLEKHITK